MTKTKIAISIDKDLLEMVDSRTDKNFLRSRSQAIDFFLRRGLQEVSIDTAVIMLKGSQFHLLLKMFKGKLLIHHQLDFFYKNGIKNVYITTQSNESVEKIKSEVEKLKINVEIIVNKAEGNAQALYFLKEKINGSFVVMSGDTLNLFELKNMVRKHLSSDKLGTIGLMSVNDPKNYGNVILDGDLVTDFFEKPEENMSNIANAGFYIFKREIFELLDNKTKSLENSILPKLAKIKQLVGYFTMGEYWHFG